MIPQKKVIDLKKINTRHRKVSFQVPPLQSTNFFTNYSIILIYNAIILMPP